MHFFLSILKLKASPIFRYIKGHNHAESLILQKEKNQLKPFRGHFKLVISKAEFQPNILLCLKAYYEPASPVSAGQAGRRAYSSFNVSESVR